MRSTLAIDFSAKCTGLAFGRPGEKPVLSSLGFARWEGHTFAEIASAVIRWLPEAFATYQPGLVIVEAPLPPAASRGPMDAQLGLGFDFLIHGACHASGIRCFSVHNKTWKASILDNGNLPSAQAKAMAMRICRGMGLEPKNDNEADAYCVWLYSMMIHQKFNDQKALAVLATLQRRLVA